MVRTTTLIVWLAATVLGAGAVAAASGEEMAEIVPRADDVSLKLSIENIDGKVVNVPETHIRRIPPGDHYLGVKIEFRGVSGGALMSGLGALSVISGAVSDQPPAHEGVSFSAQPGRRYLLNGAMVDGKPKLWIDEESYGSDREEDRR